MLDPKHEWDFFLAHAGADKAYAEALYDLLAGSAKVFLDTRSLELGDDWDRALPLAQSRALITVVLISSGTDQAYYQREEIATAIEMARKNQDSHRVIPLFLDETAEPPVYGLKVKHGLYLHEAGSLEKIALRLLGTLNKSKHQKVIYDGRNRGISFDFKGHPNSFWAGRGAEARRTSPVADGNLTFESGGILTVSRKTMVGRFEIWLLEYDYQGTRGNVVPRRDKAFGDRKIWVHCEARAIDATHGLRFILKNEETESWLANEKWTVEPSDWTPIDVYFRVDPSLDFWFRIDDEEVSRVPSRVQIRSVVLAEEN